MEKYQNYEYNFYSMPFLHGFLGFMNDHAKNNRCSIHNHWCNVYIYVLDT